MKKLFIIFSLMFLGCQNTDTAENKRAEEQFQYQNDINNANMFLNNRLLFMKDEQTHLCFAVVSTHSFTNVPCTPEVEKLVHVFSSKRF